LTIQSSQAAAFTEEDISILLTMASQVANAIENARLNERTQTALKEMEATQRRYLQKEWAEYLHSVKTTRYEVGRPGTAPLGDTVLPEMRQAAEQQKTVVLTASDQADGITHSALVTPITLRGNVIGVLGIHDDKETRQWSAEEIALVEAVTERMAQTAENLRLFDDAQRRAAREQIINATSARIRSVPTVDNILRQTVEELGRTFRASRAAIRLEVSDRNSDDHAGQRQTSSAGVS
jgi:GAF domain-containing protein